MAFQIFELSNFIKQDVYVLRTKYPRRFSSTSQSSDELIFQVMVIARNKRLAERFLFYCDADYYKDVASFIRTFNLPVGVVSLKFLK